MAKDDWRIKGGRRKGKKALKYAGLLWGDEKERRITLEDLCRCWNLGRLLKEGELQLGMLVFSQKQRYKLSHSQQMTLYYAYLVFKDWANKTQKHINGKALSKLIQYLMATTLVQNAKFCTCKEIFSFFTYDLPKLKDREGKKPRPLELYQRQSDPQALAKIHKTLSFLQNPEKVLKLGKLFGIPLR
ncbi:hypothetical protein THERU_05105 [Thermocrinis ruber]|uniref:Uncharacterized protein n=1 Tax=Thermocrinis ruber TaxID=75906 RepID=W0DHY5_9AQUI|nr:hypothetical protein [Thermocrinis ruber]AHE96852.1 hypothetical protein THERU_05105 [Thermocrinis ruber]